MINFNGGYGFNILEIKFNDIKNSEEFKNKLDEIYNRWDELSFTDGLDEDLKKECAYSFEQLAFFLIYNKIAETDALFTSQDDNFDTVGFPMIRRVLTSIKPTEFDFHNFIEYCKIFNVNDVISYLKKYEKDYNEYDTEAEGVALCCNMIEDKFRNPDKDIETIKKEGYEKYDKLIEEKIKNKDERASSDNTNE